MLKKDRLFEILNDWNYWFKPLKDFFDREEYRREIAKKSSSKEIIILKGIRRSGKSTLLLTEIKRLLKSGVDIKNILFVNFEDQRFRMFDQDGLLEEIKNVFLEYVKPKGDIVIMLDEVQNIEAWEKWVLKEYELTNNSLYITGSNSHLLSSEFGTALGGRYLDIEVYPLSFKEYLAFKDIDISSKALFIHNKIKIKQLFNEYVEFGGFPKVVLSNDKEIKRDILKVYYDTILLKDIVARYKLKNYQLLNELSLFLLSNNSTINAYNRLKNSFSTSFDTIRDYMEYLSKSYMIFSINKFDYSYKKQLANPKKIYAIDTGLSNQVSFNISKKLGQNLENIVFLELKRREKELFYYKTTNGLEIDFLIRKERIVNLIQVSATLEDEKTRQRECRVFAIAKRELKSDIRASIITLDETQTLEYDGIEIEVVNILEWLVEN